MKDVDSTFIFAFIAIFCSRETFTNEYSFFCELNLVQFIFFFFFLIQVSIAKPSIQLVTVLFQPSLVYRAIFRTASQGYTEKSSLRNIYIYLIACASVHHIIQESADFRRGCGSPGTGIIDRCRDTWVLGTKRVLCKGNKCS